MLCGRVESRMRLFHARGHMRLKAPEIEVTAKGTFKLDLLNRKPVAEAITSLIKNEEGPLVIGLNAPWGSGKTTFLRMWREDLRASGIHSVYFNAWENDFSTEPLAVLIAELEKGLDGLKQDAGEAAKVKEKLDQAKGLGVALLKRALPLAVKIGSAGLVDLGEISEEALADWTAELAKGQIAAYDAAKGSVTGFKTKLTELASEFGPSPLVVIVDEMDRCRPPYAISVLECIKHFFSVPRVVFVIAADRVQIEGAVAGVYGGGVDSSGYLRKLIDLETPLASPEGSNVCQSTIFTLCLGRRVQEARTSDCRPRSSRLSQRAVYPNGRNGS